MATQNSRYLSTPQEHSMYLPRSIGYLASLWGVGGAMVLLGLAVSRMVQHCINATEYQLTTTHYVVLIGWTLFMAYGEGYRGFQRGYSPRVAARALHLRNHSTGLRLMLAPLFCLGFFHAPRRRRITAFALVFIISLLVIAFRQLPQPWRGVLDFGVVVGLSWGIVATLIYYMKYFFVEDIPLNADVSDPFQSTDSDSERVTSVSDPLGSRLAE